jgi:hypothetical protein
MAVLRRGCCFIPFPEEFLVVLDGDSVVDRCWSGVAAEIIDECLCFGGRQWYRGWSLALEPRVTDWSCSGVAQPVFDWLLGTRCSFCLVVMSSVLLDDLGVHLGRFTDDFYSIVWPLDVYLGERTEFVWAHVFSQSLEGPFGALALYDDIDGLFDRYILSRSCCGSALFQERLSEGLCIVLDCSESGLGSFEGEQCIGECSNFGGCEVQFVF